MKKIKLLCFSLLVLVLQSCQTSETFVQPKPSIDKVLASNESKLVKGLSLLQGKIPKNGRVQKSQLDALLLDSALKLVNRKTGSTNYSLLLSRDLPYSITNLVISEKKGSYLGFVVQYVNANPDGGWNLDKFSGKIIVRSVDGTKEATMDVNPATNSKGRTEAAICTTTVTKITVSSEFGSSSYYEAEYGCLFIEWNDFGNIGDQPYEAQPGETPVSETGGGNTEEEVDYMELPGIDKTAIDIDALLRCFGSNQSGATYKLTLYVEEPVPGGDTQKVGTNAGHTFVGFTKIINGQEITQYIGFYPIHKSLTYPIESKIVNNQETEWTASVTFNVDANAFDDAIYAAHSNANRQYHISEYNCTTFALSIFDAANISLPKNEAEFPYNYGDGYSPGKLGYDLRNSGNTYNGATNFNGGTTGESKGPCK